MLPTDSQTYIYIYKHIYYIYHENDLDIFLKKQLLNVPIIYAELQTYLIIYCIAMHST